MLSLNVGKSEKNENLVRFKKLGVLEGDILALNHHISHK